MEKKKCKCKLKYGHLIVLDFNTGLVQCYDDFPSDFTQEYINNKLKEWKLDDHEISWMFTTELNPIQFNKCKN